MTLKETAHDSTASNINVTPIGLHRDVLRDSSDSSSQISRRNILGIIAARIINLLVNLGGTRLRNSKLIHSTSKRGEQRPSTVG